MGHNSCETKSEIARSQLLVLQPVNNSDSLPFGCEQTDAVCTFGLKDGNMTTVNGHAL